MTLFSPLYIIDSFVKDVLTIDVRVYFWVLYSVLFVQMSVLVPVPHCFDDSGFVILLEVWRSYVSCLIFSLRIALAILGLLWFHTHFWFVCCSSVKNVMGNLTGIALNLWIALGSMTIFLCIVSCLLHTVTILSLQFLFGCLLFPMVV